MSILAMWFTVVCCLAGPSTAAESQGSAPQSGQQQDLTQMSLEQLLQVDVVSASKFPQKAAEAPSSVTVVTADEIRRYGYRNLAEVLNSVRGFYVSNDRNYMYVGVRGFDRPGDYNSRTLLLIDGHRVNDPVYDSAYMDLTFPVDVTAIDRVEIIRGPSSSLYGTNAFFAVINVITKSGKVQNGLEAAVEKSSYGGSKGRIGGGASLANGLDIAFSGSLFDNKGQTLFFPEYSSPATNFGVAADCDYEKAQKFIAQISYHGFRLEGSYSWRRKGIPTGAFDTVFGDSRNRTDDSLAFLDLSYGRDLNDRTKLSARVYYDRYSYNGIYVYYADSAGSATVPETDLGRGDRWGAEIKADRRLFSNHLVSVGAEYRDNARVLQRTYDANALYLDDRRSSMNGGVYLQDEIKVDKKLRLNLGLRHDYYESFGGTTNPRLAVIYSPQQKTTLKLLYGQAFRAPNFYELYYRDGYSQEANADLKPDTIKTAELVLERQMGSNLQFVASTYRYWIRNLISQQTDAANGLLQFANLDAIDATGVEFELSGKWDSGLMGHTSYAFQNAHDQRSGFHLTNSPEHLLKFNLSAPILQDRVFAGLQADYMSSRLTLRGSAAAGHWLADFVVLGKKLAGGLELTAGVYNLFNQRYGDPASGEHIQDLIWQDGRNFRVRVAYGISFGK